MRRVQVGKHPQQASDKKRVAAALPAEVPADIQTRSSKNVGAVTQDGGQENGQTGGESTELSKEDLSAAAAQEEHHIDTLEQVDTPAPELVPDGPLLTVNGADSQSECKSKEAQVQDQPIFQVKTPAPRRVAYGRAAKAARLLLSTPTKTPCSVVSSTRQPGDESEHPRVEDKEERGLPNGQHVSTSQQAHLPSPVQTSAHCSEASPCPNRAACPPLDIRSSALGQPKVCRTLELRVANGHQPEVPTADGAVLSRPKPTGARGILRNRAAGRRRTKPSGTRVTWDVPLSPEERDEEEALAARVPQRASSPPPAATPVADLPGASERFGNHFAAVAARTDTLRLASGRGIRLVPGGAAAAATAGPGTAAGSAAAVRPSLSQPRRASPEVEVVGAAPAGKHGELVAEDGAADWNLERSAGIDEYDSQNRPMDDADLVLDNLDEFLGAWDVDEELDKAAKSRAGAIGRGEFRTPELGAW